MKVIPVGIYGPYPPKGEATSCYLVSGGGVTVALDFGSGALSAVQNYTDPRRLDAILLTHLHFDHCCDVLPFSYMCGEGFKLYCPATPTDCFSLIKNRKIFDTGVIADGSTITIGGLSFEFIQTVHPCESYAVKVTERGKFFVYTGDASEFAGLVEFCRGAEFVICDCCGTPGSPHMTPEKGAALGAASGTRIIATHVNPSQDLTRKLKELGISLINRGKALEF